MTELSALTKQEQAFRLRLQRLKPIIALFTVGSTGVGVAALFVDGLILLDDLSALYLVSTIFVIGTLVYLVPWEKASLIGLLLLYCLLVAVWSGATLLTGGFDSPLLLFILVLSVFFAGVTTGWIMTSLAAFSCLTVLGIWLLDPGSSGPGAAMVILVSLVFTWTYSRAIPSFHDEEYSLRQHLSSLLKISRVATNLNFEQTLDETAEAIKNGLGADGCVIYLLDSSQDALLPKVVNLSNDPGKELEAKYRLYCPRVGQGLIGLTGSVPVPRLVPDTSADPNAADLPGLSRARASVIVAPMTVAGRTTGVILLYRLSPGQFTEDDLSVATVFANEVAMAVANARLFTETARLTVTDSLTGAYNARYLPERLGEEILRARRYGHKLTLALIDSDSLKVVNDRFGHLEGDRLLKELTETVWRNIRSTDILFRYAGDEFVILLPETELDEALLVLERVRQAIAGQVFSPTNGEDYQVSVSIGVASFPDQAIGAEDLTRKADLAMYRAKALGKNRVIAWSASDGDHSQGSSAV